MKTQQEIFNTVVRGLASQGWERSLREDSTDGRERCAYRGVGGRKCAVGWLISDDGYDPSIEFRSVGTFRQVAVRYDLTWPETEVCNG